jgi:hypothetical protein
MNMTEDAIREAEQHLLNAIRTSDLPYLERTLHNDLLFIAPGGMVVTKESDLASHRSGTMVVEKIIPAIEEIRIIDDVAVAVVVYDAKGKMMNTPIEGKFRYIRFWKPAGNVLQVIGGSCTPL